MKRTKGDAMKVKDLMTTSVACVRRNDPLSAAAQIMWDCDCGAVPVKEDDGERVVGMVTDRDICIATWSRDCGPSAILVSEAASRELYACQPEDSIASAQELMSTRQIRRIPVLDGNGHLVGILSLADIVTEPNNEAARTSASELGPVEIATTLRTICQPRPNTQSAAAVH
jgi:CBS domain-containing protein